MNSQNKYKDFFDFLQYKGNLNSVWWVYIILFGEGMDEQFWQWWEQNGPINQQNEINELQVLLNQSSNQQLLQIERDHERTMDSTNADKNEYIQQEKEKQIKSYFKEADKFIQLIANKSQRLKDIERSPVKAYQKKKKTILINHQISLEWGKFQKLYESTLKYAGDEKEIILKIQQRQKQVLVQFRKFNKIYLEIFEVEEEDEENKISNEKFNQQSQNQSQSQIKLQSEKKQKIQWHSELLSSSKLSEQDGLKLQTSEIMQQTQSEWVIESETSQRVNNDGKTQTSIQCQEKHETKKQQSEYSFTKVQSSYQVIYSERKYQRIVGEQERLLTEQALKIFKCAQSKHINHNIKTIKEKFQTDDEKQEECQEQNESGEQEISNDGKDHTDGEKYKKHEQKKEDKQKHSK